MGPSPSKDMGQYDHIADRLLECFRDHCNNLKAIEKTLHSQKIAVDILTKFEATKQSDTGEQNDTGKATCNDTINDRLLLSNIQDVLLLQCNITGTNFKHLKECVRDAVETVADRRNFTPSWKLLLEELSVNRYGQSATSQTEQYASDSSLLKYSPDQVEIQHKLLMDTSKLQDFQNDRYQSRKDDERYRKHYETMLDQKDVEINRLRCDIERMEPELRRLSYELHDFKSKYQNASSALQAKGNECYKLHTENGRLNNDIKILHRMNQELEHKIKIKNKPRVPLQLYYLRNDELMMTVVNELGTMLKTHTGLHDFEIDVSHCTQPSDVKPNVTVLALCINAVRLGTDAVNAIQGLRSSSRIALLMFHHKDLHAVPTQRSDRMLTGYEFKELGGIFDLAFLRGKGIYSCDLNNIALESITKFIKDCK